VQLAGEAAARRNERQRRERGENRYYNGRGKAKSEEITQGKYR